MEDDPQLAQTLTHLLARVEAYVARDEASDSTLPALPQFGGSLWAPSPQRSLHSSPFFSFPGDVNSDTVDMRRAVSRHTHGPGTRPSSVSPGVLSSPVAKTPSTAVSPLTVGLTPTTCSASGTRGQGPRAAANGGTTTATTSASSTPFWFQQSHACGVSVCDSLSSLNLMHNLSPVHTPLTNRASKTHGQSASHPHSMQTGLVLLNGGSYTMPQPSRSRGPISPIHPQPTVHHSSSHRPRHATHLQHMHNSHTSLDVPSDSLRDTVLLPPSRHTVPPPPPSSSSLSSSMRSPTHDTGALSPTRVELYMSTRQQPTGAETCPGLRAEASGTLSGSACTPDASLRVPFQLSLHRGSVVKMGSDQHGCRALQSVLECYAFDTSEVQCIVSELRPVLSQVMTNPYGNFLVQKLLEIAPDEERLQLLSQYLSTSLCEVAVSPHGNYAVQKLIDSLRSREEVEVVCAALQRNVLILMNDINGGHVVQKLLQCLPQADVVFLYDTIVDRTLDVCNDKQGCCIVQKCMDYASAEQLQRVQRAILHHLLPLSMSPYGNYVVTHLIKCCNGTQGTQIVDEAAYCARPAMDLLCVNKFASNVVESIVRHCSEHAKVELCRLILQGSVEDVVLPLSGNNITKSHNNTHSEISNTNEHSIGGQKTTVLRTIALNPYGNYVIQTLLSVLPLGAELLQLLRCLQRLLPELLELNFGKRVEAKMDHAKCRIAQHCQQKGTAHENSVTPLHSDGLFRHNPVHCADTITTATVTNNNNNSAAAAAAARTADPRLSPAAALLPPRGRTAEAAKGHAHAFFASPSLSLAAPAQQRGGGGGARYRAKREGRTK